MRYRYFTCDVFTQTRFGGNPLAVLPEAEGLSDDQMQQIAREFNFSETTFVFASQTGCTRRVRIYTPSRELPFAGHPNIGTAFVLASMGAFGSIDDRLEVSFEEPAGRVPIVVRRRSDGRLDCELAAPQPLTLGKTVSASALAESVSLAETDVVTTTHLPRVASVGLPFLIAELNSPKTLEAAHVRPGALEALAARGFPPDLHLYVRSQDEFDLRARMFAPLEGVPEDPATGSANCALAGMLSHYAPEEDGRFRWRIAQGVEMGRPSVLEARTQKARGKLTGIWVGGSSVIVCEGTIQVD